MREPRAGSRGVGEGLARAEASVGVGEHVVVVVNERNERALVSGLELLELSCGRNRPAIRLGRARELAATIRDEVVLDLHVPLVAVTARLLDYFDARRNDPVVA